ncbi:MAG TPA: DUF4339 domain-containing protein [Gemmataceae bacterium]|nr:DUF4339 domain-containing protein [Gemmataceae bacterium]
MADEWFYANNGQPTGPVTSTALRELAVTGMLKPSDLVWQEGMSQWAPASTTRGLFPAATPPKEPSPTAEAIPTVAPRLERPSRRSVDDYARGRRPISQRRKSALGTGAKVAIIGGIVFALFLVAVVGVAIIAIVADSRPRARPVAYVPPPPPPPQWQPPKQFQPVPKFKGGANLRPGPVGANSYPVNLDLPGQENEAFIQFKQNEQVEISVITNTWAGAEPNLDLYVFDPNGMEIPVNNYTSKDCYVKFVATQAGQYRVVVKLFKGSRVGSTVHY